MAFIESLESRVLLSVTPALTATQSAIRVIRTGEAEIIADIRTLTRQSVIDGKTIGADLKRLGVTRTDASLVKASVRAGATIIVALTRVELRGSAAVNRFAAKLVAVEAQLAKHPTNTALQDKATADNTALTNAASDTLNDFTAFSSTTTFYDDLNSIASANSGDAQTGTDVTTTETDFTNNLNTADNNATTVYDTDVPALQGLF